MTVDEARKWLIVASLSITGGQIFFLLTAPVLGYPLKYPRNLDLLQIISPVFLGYLGSATHFVFQNPPQTVPVQNQFLGLLVKGPLLIYMFAVIAAFGTFGYANRDSVQPVDSSMSIEHLATALSVALGVLAVTTGVITSYLFVRQNPNDTEAH